MIRRRLLWAMLAPLLLVLLAAGFYLQYRLGEALERELSGKLQALSAAVAQDVDAELVALFNPGDEETRVFRNMRSRLLELAQVTDLQRIMVFAPDGGVWLDSAGEAPIASVYVRLGSDRREIYQALDGRAASSTLFRGSDGRLWKSAYAPLRHGDRISGVVMVEGSAQSLQLVRQMQRTLLQIGLFAAAAAAVLAWLLAAHMTRPLAQLRTAAVKIGAGNLQDPIPAKGRDEVAFLGRTMEEMRQAVLTRIEQQKAMLAGVAHEIRNPLAGIELFAGLVQDEAESAAMKQKAERILKETRNLKALVQHFLEYARPIEPKPQRCAVAAAWQACCELLQAEIGQRPFSFQLQGQGDVRVDPLQLQQMLFNLLLNGVQSMDKGGAISGRVGTEGDFVSLEIADQGHGIPENDQPHIFEPFFSRKENGMGLGLAMVRNLAVANRGEIVLLSSSCEGSTFRLCLPLAHE